MVVTIFVKKKLNGRSVLISHGNAWGIEMHLLEIGKFVKINI